MHAFIRCHKYVLDNQQSVAQSSIFFTTFYRKKLNCLYSMHVYSYIWTGLFVKVITWMMYMYQYMYITISIRVAVHLKATTSNWRERHTPEPSCNVCTCSTKCHTCTTIARRRTPVWCQVHVLGWSTSTFLLIAIQKTKVAGKLLNLSTVLHSNPLWRPTVDSVFVQPHRLDVTNVTTTFHPVEVNAATNERPCSANMRLDINN